MVAVVHRAGGMDVGCPLVYDGDVPSEIRDFQYLRDSCSGDMNVLLRGDWG